MTIIVQHSYEIPYGSKAVQRPGVVVKNFINDLWWHGPIFFELAQSQNLRRSIVVPIIGTDNQLIFARIFQHVREVVIGLARYVDSVSSQHVFLVHLLSTALQPSGKVMNRIGHPLRTYLDESELGLGELVRDLVED